MYTEYEDNNSLERKFFCFVSKVVHGKERRRGSTKQCQEPECFFGCSPSIATGFHFVKTISKKCNDIEKNKIYTKKLYKDGEFQEPSEHISVLQERLPPCDIFYLRVKVL